MARKPRKQLTLDQRRANPATRSKLSMSQLTPEQRGQRRSNQRIARENANPLYDPATPLAGHNLASAARQIVAAQIDPQAAELDRQTTNLRLQQGGLAQRAKSYYQGLAAEEAARHAKMQALADTTNRQVGDVGKSVQGDFDIQQQAQDAARRSDASSRGQGLQGGDQAAQELAAARSRSGQLQGAAQTSAAEQGARYTALSDLVGRAIQLRGEETQGRLATGESNALNELAAKHVDLAAQRGNLIGKTTTDLREKSFEDLATLGGLNLKASDLSQRAASDRANRQVKLTGIRTTARTNAANRASRESTAAAGRAVTTRGQDIASADRRAAAQRKEQARLQGVRGKASKAWGDVATALGLVKSGARAPVTDAKGNAVPGKTRAATTEETIAALRAKKLPEWAVQAAISIHHHGVLTPEVIQLIRTTAPDVRIPRQYLPSSGLRRRPSTMH